jgi:hypothetical protein
MKSTRWGLGLLGVAGLLLGVTHDANAWLLHHCCGGRHCCMQICCRQYNAFTPVCFGNIHCDGCCPNFGCAPMNCCGGGCAMPGPVCAALNPFPAMAGIPMQMPPMMMGAGMPLPPGMSMPTGMPMTPGAPMPPGPGTPPAGNVPPILNHTAQYANPAMYYGVQPAGYNPGYYGYYANAYGYNPYVNWAAMANPYYAYGYDQQPR